MTDTTAPDPTSPAGAKASGGEFYRVLARKYRPSNFAELIGQDALVRTLTNAIASGRIAHAFVLTGVRGVGKTTTARIIARALNCIGPDGQGGPTITPCGMCTQCRAIAEDRHVDILEIDAASHTGVDDVRDLTDGVRYSPVSARFKVYIIDEVHMLSKAAWNALLKTLEEPPPHVKFVFATTEIRKVPVTVLSRCQRFDLRRVPAPTLVTHFQRIAGAEAVALDDDAAALIARAADGSVRDGLSLLDQAIALTGGHVTTTAVRDMLGLADRSRVIDLFVAAITGKPAAALAVLADLHRDGADPLVVLHDLLDFTHFLTRCRVVPETAEDPTAPEMERQRGGSLAPQLSMPTLTRAWQILLKGVNEVQNAPVPQHALDMVVIRLTYATDLPNPADLVRSLQSSTSSSAGPAGTGGSGSHSGGSGGSGGGPRGSGLMTGMGEMGSRGGLRTVASGGGGSAASPVPQREALVSSAVPAPDTVTVSPEPAAAALVPMPRDFPALVQLFANKCELVLHGHLFSAVHLVRFEPGRLELRIRERAPANLANRIGALLGEWTGQRWLVTVSGAPGQPTLAEQANAAAASLRADVERHPLVRAVLEHFPGARISDIRDSALTATGPAGIVADDGAESGAADAGDDLGILPEPYDDEGEMWSP